MPELALPCLWRTALPHCLICFLFACSFYLSQSATNSLIYSTVCLLRANASFCTSVEQNKSSLIPDEIIQKQSSEWSLYGTLTFSLVACFISPIYGSLSDTTHRMLPIVLTLSNSIITGLISTTASVYQGTRLCLILYLVANVVHGLGGGGVNLISSCFGYVTDSCVDKQQHVQVIAAIEASLNIGVVMGYVLCTLIFELNGRLWHILLLHVTLLVLALLISLAFLKDRSPSQTSSITLYQKVAQLISSSRDLILELKNNHLILSFLLLLLSIFFYDSFRMGSGSTVYLYLHHMSFDDTHYTMYLSFEQLATCLALFSLALLRRTWKINDLYLAIIGLCCSLVAPMLFAFARNNKAMIFGAIPSSMFSAYFSVCLRAIIAHLVPEKSKGKAFGFVALMQNLDILLGTLSCVKIYQASIDFFPGFVFLFAVTTKLVALILILIYMICVNRKSTILTTTQVNDAEQPILESITDDDDNTLTQPI